jgi:hypothetical protein
MSLWQKANRIPKLYTGTLFPNGFLKRKSEQPHLKTRMCTPAYYCPDRIYWRDQVKDDDMDSTCSMYGEMKVHIKINS